MSSISVTVGPLECIHLLLPNQDSTLPIFSVCSLGTAPSHFPFPNAGTKLGRSKLTHYTPLSNHRDPSEPVRENKTFLDVWEPLTFPTAQKPKRMWGLKLLPFCYHVVADTETNWAEDRAKMRTGTSFESYISSHVSIKPVLILHFKTMWSNNLSSSFTSLGQNFFSISTKEVLGWYDHYLYSFVI